MKDILPRKNRNFLMNDEFLTDIFDDSPLSLLTPRNIKVDIKETEKEYMIEADLPGVKKEDIVVEYKDNYLTISAKKEETIEETKENYIRHERSFGEIKRSFYIDDIDDAHAEVEYVNGVLKIMLPKLTEPKRVGKRLEIK